MNPRHSIFIAALLGILPAAALAGPGEDAMAGVVKCSTLLDDRARLTCYDSAVPQVRVALTAAGRTAAPPVAFASAQPMNAQPSNSQSVNAQRVNPPPPARKEQGWLGGLFGSDDTRPPEQYGSERLASNAPAAPAARLTARVTGFTIAPYTHTFTVTLDNGQIWQQNEGDTTIAALDKKSLNTYVASIEPGFLGSYTMHIRGVPGGFKVKRLR